MPAWLSYPDPQKFRSKHNLPFSLISDKDKKITSLFGVRSIIGSAKRITFWIGGDGLIKHVWDKVKVGTHPQDILKVYKTG
ncbi:MAG: redoxin domain-containing protein [Candidatus Hodarchaeales archaeon]